MKKMTAKKARELGRDEGVAFAVAGLVKSYGTSTESMELAQAWGMTTLLVVADESDRPHLERLCKDYPNHFRGCRARAERKRKEGKP